MIQVALLFLEINVYTFNFGSSTHLLSEDISACLQNRTEAVISIVMCGNIQDSLVSVKKYWG